MTVETLKDISFQGKRITISTPGGSPIAHLGPGKDDWSFHGAPRNADASVVPGLIKEHRLEIDRALTESNR